jgi:hypothetical protein
MTTCPDCQPGSCRCSYVVCTDCREPDPSLFLRADGRCQECGPWYDAWAREQAQERRSAAPPPDGLTVASGPRRAKPYLGGDGGPGGRYRWVAGCERCDDEYGPRPFWGATATEAELALSEHEREEHAPAWAQEGATL